MLQLRGIIVGHGGHQKIGGKLTEAMRGKRLTLRPCLSQVGAGDGLTNTPQSHELIRQSHVLIVELSEFSASTGRASTMEQTALEIASHAAIPCVLVVNSVWHATHPSSVGHPAICEHISLVILHTNITSHGIDEVMARFPHARPAIFTEATAADIFDWLADLAEEYFAARVLSL